MGPNVYGQSIDELINSLRVLPGVGAKSAHRMAMHLLQKDKEGAKRLAQSIFDSVNKVRHCQKCRAMTESPVCVICSSSRVSSSQVCVVENIADLHAIEQAGAFFGTYFVLHGHLSPIDGVGAEELGIDKLFAQINSREINELILATNLTLEGEATSHFIAERARAINLKVSRIAYGVPLGGELEYVDGGTLSLALKSRKTI